MRTDFFYRLPPPTAILLLSALFDPTLAHILQTPRQTPAPTTTLPHHALHVVPWPRLPTTPPQSPFDLRRRQDDTNTICGYIGGQSSLPATCGAGSHCVLDVDHNVVGCCPNGESTCTSGIFTSCVDANSGPQTVVNPYVYTCGGSDVCYKNQYDGGFSQYGCGTASNLATVVLAAASGLTTSLDRPTISVSLTQSISTLSTPTTVGTISSSTDSSSSKSSSSTQSSSSSTHVGPPHVSQTNPPPISADGAGAPGSDHIGPIVGGTIGGIAVVIALIALIFFYLRNRRRNARIGPGPGSETYVISPPKSGTGSGFTAVHQSSEGFETGLPAVTMAPGGGPANPVFSTDLSAGGPSPYAYHGAAGNHNSYPPPHGYHYPGQYPAAYAGVPAPGIMSGVASGVMQMQAVPRAPPVGGNGKAPMEPEREPLARDADELPGGYHQGLGRIGEEEEDRARSGMGFGSPRGGDLSDGSGMRGGSGSGNGESSGSGNEESGSPGSKPLWQQNRRTSRNQVWM